MDLRCKFGVDSSLPVRNRAIFICAILKTNIHKMASFNWNYVTFLYTRSVTRKVAFSRGRRAFKLCIRAAKVSSKVPCCH